MPLRFPYADADRLLTERGFAKVPGRSVYVWTTRLADGVEGWVSIGKLGVSRTFGSRPTAWTLAPGVGVRHLAANRWALALTGHDPLAEQMVTVTTPLFRLLPPERERPHWVVDAADEDGAARAYARLGRDLDEFGLPWQRDRVTVPALLAAVRRGEVRQGHGPLLEPVLAWMAGDAAGAVAALANGRRSDVEQHLRVDYAAFSARLLAAVEARPDGPGAEVPELAISP